MKTRIDADEKKRRLARMKFTPEEVLFCPTTRCNLNCLHCVTEKSNKVLSIKDALIFLRKCKRYGIKKVGFTGGEPFLVLNFLCSVSREAVKNGMFFDRIMTNGVWFKSRPQLENALKRLYKAGYDGSICVSVDAFHKQNLSKLGLFVKMASVFWDVYIASTIGAREKETNKKLEDLSRLLKRKLRVYKINLSPVGYAGRLKNPWDGRWFKEDYCRGPGNVFYVMPDGDVKPCCGYASDLPGLTIGNIKQGVNAIMAGFKKNKFVYGVFNSGLTSIRKRLERKGIRFPGKTSNNCFFCWYVLKTKLQRV